VSEGKRYEWLGSVGRIMLDGGQICCPRATERGALDFQQQGRGFGDGGGGFAIGSALNSPSVGRGEMLLPAC